MSASARGVGSSNITHTRRHVKSLPFCLHDKRGPTCVNHLAKARNEGLVVGITSLEPDQVRMRRRQPNLNAIRPLHRMALVHDEAITRLLGLMERQSRQV